MSTNIQPVDLMSPGANLEAYIQAVNTIPLLSVEEEKELAEKLYYDADLRRRATTGNVSPTFRCLRGEVLFGLRPF